MRIKTKIKRKVTQQARKHGKPHPPSPLCMGWERQEVMVKETSLNTHAWAPLVCVLKVDCRCYMHV